MNLDVSSFNLTKENVSNEENKETDDNNNNNNVCGHDHCIKVVLIYWSIQLGLVQISPGRTFARWLVDQRQNSGVQTKSAIARRSTPKQPSCSKQQKTEYNNIWFLNCFLQNFSCTAPIVPEAKAKRKRKLHVILLKHQRFEMLFRFF